MSRRALTLVVALSLAGCGDDATTTEVSPEGAQGQPPASRPPAEATGPEASSAGLTAAALYTRASLDLRGVRPTSEDLDLLEAEPERLSERLDALLESPRFPARLKDLFAPAFRTRVDGYPFIDEGRYDAPGQINAAIAEEPLDLVAWIATEGRPFTDIVLAEHTVVRPVLLDHWPLEAMEGAAPEGTTLARYTDDRPKAGVLSMNAMWWRHTSTEENANRGRANAVSSALLCESYLDRPIAFPRDVDLTDSESIHDAIRTSSACAACHSTLDPLASHLWGFMYPGEGPEVWSVYHPARERDWRATTEAPPAYFGKPTGTLRDLAVQIASDERFVMCAVRRVYEGLMGRPLTVQDDGALATHREAFLASGLKLKALVRSVLDDPAYRGLSRRAEFGGRPEAATYTLMTPAIFAEDLEALTGYRARIEGRDLLSLDYSLRAVAGGSDQGAATTPSTGLVLVQRRLSEAAAVALVDGETEGRLSAILDGELDEPPRPVTLKALLRAATGRRVEASGAEVQALRDLWGAIDGIADRREAWIGVLTAVLADPERLAR